jgi:tetratricopeptide (TPR) repeat protein
MFSAWTHGPVARATILVLLWGVPLGCKRPQPTTPSPASQPATTPSDFVGRHNRAVGLMGRFEFDAALSAFEQLAQSRSDDADVRTNLAIATLNRQREGDAAKALELLDGVLARHADHARARYCKGILLLHGGKPAEAMEAFRAVATVDPRDAYARYHAGQCLMAMNKPAEALPEFEAALTIDPKIRSAYYGAFQALQRLGKPEQAKARLAEFQALKDNPQARLVEFKYTRMGPKAEVAVVDATAEMPAATRPIGPAFAPVPSPLKITNATDVPWRKPGDTRPISITAADIDGDGNIDLFITNAWGRGGLTNAVLLRRGNSFELDAKHPLASVTGVNAALWGDFDNDGLTDVYLCRNGPNQLWRQTEKGKWQDVTASTQTSGGNFDTIDGAFFDADHDGDLDLILVRRNGPTELLSNNMDGTFRAIGVLTGIAGDGREAIGVVVADLDSDDDVDLIVLKRQPPHDVFLNDRQWRYRRGEALKRFADSPTEAVVAADADADGRVELYSLWKGIGRWTRSADGSWEGPAQSERAAPSGSARLALADVTGEGTLSAIVTRGPDAIEIENIPTDGRLDRLSHVETPFPWTQWALVVLDPASGPSIVAMSPDGGPPIIKSASQGRFPFAAISLTGKHNQADQMRSNASGVGVKIAARVGSRWIATSTYPKAHSSPGQSLQPVCIGLGGAWKADFISITWPDGLRQTELEVPAGKLRVIPETQRQTSSCPVIFAWNGNQWAFVTDCLGVGGIGFALGPPGQYVPPRPWENVLLPEGAIAPRDGEYRIKLAEPMEEACYLDAAKLVAYDLPPAWSMTLDERMGVNHPQPTGRPVFFRRSITPIEATNDRGENVTAAVVKADHVAVEPGERDRRFVGFCKEHWVALKFDQSIKETGGEPVLIIDGWIEYPYSQTMFAAWQARVTYDAPTLEARAAGGEWVPVLEHFGYPAGMPRQMSVPIPRDKLPKGARELRLRTNQEIYWDRIAIARAEPCPQARRIELPLRRAALAETGFARRLTFPQKRPSYDYARRDPLWDAGHQDGFYTAFGPVEELVSRTDDALTVFGPGEEVELAFSESNAPPSGWTRRYVLELAGWCKDRDLYTKDGETVGPLPGRDGARDRSRVEELHRRYNTRYRSGGAAR